MTVSLYRKGQKIEDLNVFTYSDSTPGAKAEWWSSIHQADTVVLTGTSLAEFFVTCMVGHIHPHMTLITPYLIGARQDRQNPNGDILFTLNSVARWLENSLFDRVIALDVHSKEAFHQINFFENYRSSQINLDVFQNKYDAIVAPDAGALDRALSFADKLNGIAVYQGNKTRDTSNGKITNISINVDPGKHYLLVDDICDGGGTFIPLAQQIKEQGSTADLFVSHGIFSRGTEELKQHFNNIYTTDSICTRDDVIIIPVVEDMIKYASRNF